MLRGAPSAQTAVAVIGAITLLLGAVIGSAKHLYPIQLSEELARLCVDPQIHITHLKPSDRELIAREIETWAGRFQPRILQTGDVLVID